MIQHDPTVAEQAAQLAQNGHIGKAVQLLEDAIVRGDGRAALMLAGWRLSGETIRRDLSAARELFGKATELGLDEIEPFYIALLASGAGGSKRHWDRAIELLSRRTNVDPRARQEKALLATMQIDSDGDPICIPSTKTINDTPQIRSIPGFLSADECHLLCEIASPLLRPATVGDPSTGQLVRDPIRRASCAGFPFIAESPFIHAINRRIAAATGTSYDQGEPLQIIAYDPGEEFKLHSDAVTHDPNQRIITFLVTLEAGFTGGETAFPRLGLKFRGGLGDALYFTNINAVGKIEPLAWHAGLPVNSGRKIILSKWIRAQPLDVSGPPGKPF